MEAIELENFRVLIVPGLRGSGPGHWQTRWQALFPRFERVVQRDWDVPDLRLWSARVAETLHQSSRPTLLVAHSFGCLAAVHGACAGVPQVAGALLVAPADPHKFGVEREMRCRTLPFPSIVIGSLDDPWMDGRRAAEWADAWGSDFINAGALGHINAESHLGDWDYGLALMALLASRVSPSLVM